MTREEAKNILLNVAWLGTNRDREHTEEAVKIAVKAINQIEKWSTWNKTYENMMQNTINRQAAIDAVIEAVDDWDGGYNITRAEVIEKAINGLPSAQPRERGHWIEINDKYNRISGRCSVCGWESHMYEDDVVGMNYCPNCGAKMEVEE